MNGNRNHTLYGVLFILACLIIAGGLYAIIRTPASPAVQSTEATENTQLNIEKQADALRNVERDANEGQEQDAAAAQPVRDNGLGVPQLGMCRMDDCSWAKDQSRQVVKSDNRGTLVKILLLGGSSKDDKSPITWNAAPHDVYVFCSQALPSILMEDEGSWQVDVLDFVDGVPGVLESSQALYMRTCHSTDHQFPNDAEALGYASIPDEREDVKVSRAEDIFDRATGIQ